MTKVDITTAGHTIVIESDDNLDIVATRALQLWRDTRDPKLDQAYAATGFIAERAEPNYTTGQDIEMGRQR